MHGCLSLLEVQVCGLELLPPPFAPQLGLTFAWLAINSPPRLFLEALACESIGVVHAIEDRSSLVLELIVRLHLICISSIICHYGCHTIHRNFLLYTNFPLFRGIRYTTCMALQAQIGSSLNTLDLRSAQLLVGVRDEDAI